MHARVILSDGVLNGLSETQVDGTRGKGGCQIGSRETEVLFVGLAQSVFQERLASSSWEGESQIILTLRATHWWLPFARVFHDSITNVRWMDR